MQIPKEIEKCIVFLGCNSKKGFYLGGTAFFVAVTLEEFNDKYVSCLVTARHNIDRIRKDSIDNKVYIRVNLIDGTANLIASKIDDWVAHQDKSVDVSVLSWSPPQTEIDFLPINLKDLMITNEIIEKEEIGAGYEIFLTGLFYNHY